MGSHLHLVDAPPLSPGATAFLLRFPLLYHVSQAPAVDTIQRHGLLSASATLDLLGTSGNERDRLERTRRPKSELLGNETDGMFVLNDQCPLNLKGLARCLTDMTEEEWLLNLNRRVFFFPSLKATKPLTNAVRARDRMKLVLEYRTADILQVGEGECAVASINTGYTLRQPAARGTHTYVPLTRYGRRPQLRVREFCVLHSIPAKVPFRVVDTSGW